MPQIIGDNKVFSVSYKGWNAKDLFVCCCFLSHSKILHFYGDVTIIVEGLQIFLAMIDTGHLEVRVLYRTTPTVTRGIRL